METTSRTDTHATSGPPPTSAPAAAPRAAAAADKRQLRRERVDEYEAHGLTNPLPFAGTMTAVQADLLRAALVTGPRMNQELANIKSAPDGVKQVERSINSHLRVVRQIQRFAELELRSFEARQKAELLADKLAQDPLRNREGIERSPSWGAPQTT